MSSRSSLSTTKMSSRSSLSATNIQEKQARRSVSSHIQDSAYLETTIGSTVDGSSRHRSSWPMAADEERQSGMGKKQPKSKVRNSDKRRKSNAITTGDGVDHHCQCVVM
jgi:hypothetical protein